MKNMYLPFKGYSIHELDAANLNLYELSNFIIEENYKHHKVIYERDILDAEIKKLYIEECSYSCYSKFFVARDAMNKMIGVIRLMKWNMMCELPIQKIFDINPLRKIQGRDKYGAIWHVGRFAVTNSKDISSLSLFKQLLIFAIAPIYKNSSDIIVAECDSKLIRVLSILGIEFNYLGNSLQYLGSETIPIYLTQSGIVHFFDRFKKLIRPTQEQRILDGICA